jgi:hypothetical protein
MTGVLATMTTDPDTWTADRMGFRFDPGQLPVIPLSKGYPTMHDGDRVVHPRVHSFLALTSTFA